MKRGKCELCRFVRDLHDSHFLPRAGYKNARAKGIKNPNPVVISGGRAKQSSLQVRDYKFCTECETRFNRGGESWVLSVVPTDYGQNFAIHDLLDTARGTLVRDGLLLFPAANIPKIDLEKLVYFGMSIFWRGTLRWSPVGGGQPPKLFMNVRQENAVRRFLLGTGGLPNDTVITVAVWPFKKVSPMNFVPTLDPATSYRRYWFYFSGFVFSLALGKKTPDDVRKTCAYGSKVLTLSIDIGQAAWDAIRKQVQSVDKSAIQETLQEIAVIRSKMSTGE